MKRPTTLPPEEKEAFHQAAESRIQTFGYKQPTAGARPKDTTWLVKSGMIKLLVQVIRDGVDQNLHYHTNSETIWMVLRGRVRFHGVGDKMLAELGPEEGILLPGGSRYWFERIGPETLELMQMIAVDQASGDDVHAGVEQH